MGPLGGFRRGSGAYRADDLPGRDALPHPDVGPGLEVGVGGLVSPVVVNYHHGAHHGILRDGAHRAGTGGQHRGALGGGDVQAVVGAPVRHSLVVHQLIHGKNRYHLAVQGRDNEPGNR